MIVRNFRRTCQVCGAEFQAFLAVQKYCSFHCRNKAAYERAKPYLQSLHVKQAQARAQHRYKRGHRDEIGARSRKLMREFGQIWGLNGSRDSKSSEAFAFHLLPTLGFSAVKDLTKYRKSFPFDLLAEKDGRPCFIEVTTNRMHQNNSRFEMASDFGLDLYFLFVRPALDGYYLVKAEESKFSYYIPYPVLRRREWNRID